MSKQIVMKNPQLNHLLIELESPIWSLAQIWSEDLKNERAEYQPTDSTVKSAIRRVMGHLKGRPPKPLRLKKEKDQWLENLTQNIWQVCRNRIGESTKKSDLLICLAAIEYSIKTHTVGDPRGYLEFLDGFFKDLGMTAREVDEETAKEFMT